MHVYLRSSRLSLPCQSTHVITTPRTGGVADLLQSRRRRKSTNFKRPRSRRILNSPDSNPNFGLKMHVDYDSNSDSTSTSV